MADLVKVRLQRAYLWDNEQGGVESYGPGEVEIPRAMAAGLQREKIELGLDLSKTQEGDVHPKIFAQRESDASTRSVKAATALAKRFGLEENESALKVEHEQPDQQQVLRDEAVADALEALLKATPDDVGTLVGDAARKAEEAVGQRLKEAAKQGRDALLAVIEELPGIGPRSIETIGNALETATPETPPVPVESVGTATVETVEQVPVSDTSGESPDATS